VIVSVPLVGQFENLGDIILRRQLARWLAPAGQLNVYVGPATAEYVEGLELPADARVHTDLMAWMRSILAAEGGSSFAFMPGEVVLSRDHIRDHLGVLPAVAAVKARGGKVIRVGEGIRADSRLAALMRPSVLAADVLAWRDELTRSVFGRGTVMPDLAFAEGSSQSELDALDAAADRPYLAVSLRADRPAQDAVWLAAVRAAAQQLGLRILAVSQVKMDAASAERLGRELDADVLPWDPAAESGQEERLRAAYRRSALVLSDRLHVLIAGLTEGAVPLGLTQGGQQAKVARNFEAAGLPGVGVDGTGWSADRLTERIVAAAGARESTAGQLVSARARLDAVRAEVHATLLVREPLGV
jgi:hypothetical protein